MSLTVVDALLNKLYDVMIADATIAAGITAETIKVFDGPIMSDFAGPTILTIGARPVVDDESVTQVDRDWNTMGVNATTAQIKEMYEIPCGISTRDANSNMRTCRGTAFGWYATASAVIRAIDTLISPTIPQVMWGQPQMASIRQLRGQNGCDVVVNFNAVVITVI